MGTTLYEVSESDRCLFGPKHVYKYACKYHVVISFLFAMGSKDESSLKLCFLIRFGTGSDRARGSLWRIVGRLAKLVRVFLFFGFWFQGFFRLILVRSLSNLNFNLNHNFIVFSFFLGVIQYLPFLINHLREFSLGMMLIACDLYWHYSFSK